MEVKVQSQKADSNRPSLMGRILKAKGNLNHWHPQPIKSPVHQPPALDSSAWMAAATPSLHP